MGTTRAWQGDGDVTVGDWTNVDCWVGGVVPTGDDTADFTDAIADGSGVAPSLVPDDFAGTISAVEDVPGGQVDFSGQSLAAGITLEGDAVIVGYVLLRADGQQARYATVTGGVEEAHQQGSVISGTFTSKGGFSPSQVKVDGAAHVATIGAGTFSVTLDEVSNGPDQLVQLFDNISGTLWNIDTIEVADAVPVYPDPSDVRPGVLYGPDGDNFTGALASTAFLIATPDNPGVVRVGGVHAALVRAADTTEARKITRGLAEGGSKKIWRDAPIVDPYVVTVEGWTFAFGAFKAGADIVPVDQYFPATSGTGTDFALSPRVYEGIVKLIGEVGETFTELLTRLATAMDEAGIGNPAFDAEMGIISFDEIVEGYSMAIVPPTDLFVIDPHQTDVTDPDYNEGPDFNWFTGPGHLSGDSSGISFDLDWVVPAVLITSEDIN